jgi:hypothetical protein
MQDEPESRACFSHKMSLEEQFGMLGVDRQHASTRMFEPGTDPGIFRGQQ